MCIRKIKGIFELLPRVEIGDPLSVGDITHRYSNIRFDEMPVVPVQPRTIYRRWPEAETIRLPEIIKYDEEKDNGKST